MRGAPLSRRDRIRAQLADLKMPGALESLDEILSGIDAGAVTAAEAIERVLGAQIALRNARRLEAAMRSSRLPAVKTLAGFDFAFQPSLKREQIESLHELGFVERKENVVFLGPPGVGKSHLAISLAIAAAENVGCLVEWPVGEGNGGVYEGTYAVYSPAGSQVLVVFNRGGWKSTVVRTYTCGAPAPNQSTCKDVESRDSTVMAYVYLVNLRQNEPATLLWSVPDASIGVLEIADGDSAVVIRRDVRKSASHSDMLNAVEAATRKVIEMGYIDPRAADD